MCIFMIKLSPIMCSISRYVPHFLFYQSLNLLKNAYPTKELHLYHQQQMQAASQTMAVWQCCHIPMHLATHEPPWDHALWCYTVITKPNIHDKIYDSLVHLCKCIPMIRVRISSNVSQVKKTRRIIAPTTYIRPFNISIKLNHIVREFVWETNKPRTLRTSG